MAAQWGPIWHLTVQGLGLGRRLFLLSPQAGLFDAFYFPPEILHGGTVYGGLRVGAAERRGLKGLIGEHPVDSSAWKNSMVRGVWWATVYAVAKSDMTEHTSI